MSWALQRERETSVPTVKSLPVKKIFTSLWNKTARVKNEGPHLHKDCLFQTFVGFITFWGTRLLYRKCFLWWVIANKGWGFTLNIIKWLVFIISDRAICSNRLTYAPSPVRVLYIQSQSHHTCQLYWIFETWRGILKSQRKIFLQFFYIYSNFILLQCSGQNCPCRSVLFKNSYLIWFTWGLTILSSQVK